MGHSPVGPINAPAGIVLPLFAMPGTNFRPPTLLPRYCPPGNRERLPQKSIIRMLRRLFIPILMGAIAPSAPQADDGRMPRK